MASTVLPNGIIIPEKYSRDWYNDLYHNWQELDNLLSASPGNGTLTIRKNGTTVGTFSANQATDETVNISVPTATSELTNDSGYLTSSSNLDASKLTSGTVDIARLPQGALERLVKVADEAARYALTTADVQLGDSVQQLDTGIMYAVTDTDHLDSAAGYTEYTAGTAASVPWSGVTGKPTIPTVNDATLTIQKNGTTVETFTANSSSDKTVNITVPTKTSDLTNDSGFITSDNTKIPLSGSNAISGDLIPSTDNSIDIGSSTNNIKMLYTKGITINGTQFLPSNYMTLDTVQTVTSVKNYSGYQNINAYRLCIKSLDQKKGVIPASNQWNGFSFNDKNDERMFSIEQGILVDGSVVLNFSGRANDNDTTFTTFLRYINNSDLTTNFVNVINLMPFGNGTRKLGDTNAKWKSFNGINPGALSLPSSTVSMNLIGDVSVVGTEKKLSKDITVTGYIYADVSFTSSNRLNLYNDTKKYGICMPCDSGRIRQIMPISAGDRLEFNVLDNGSTVNVIQLFACQGNV